MEILFWIVLTAVFVWLFRKPRSGPSFRERRELSIIAREQQIKQQREDMEIGLEAGWAHISGLGERER